MKPVIKHIISDLMEQDNHLEMKMGYVTEKGFVKMDGFIITKCAPVTVKNIMSHVEVINKDGLQVLAEIDLGGLKVYAL